MVIPALRMRKLSLRVSVDEDLEDEDPGGQEREDGRRRDERLRPGTLPPPPGSRAPAQRACALQGSRFRRGAGSRSRAMHPGPRPRRWPSEGGARPQVCRAILGGSITVDFYNSLF